MDIIITDHSPQNLETHYENHLVYQNARFSIMCEATEIPWLQFIPNRSLANIDYAMQLYGEIYRLAEHLKQQDLAPHYNVAKIGNKLPYYHIHLVFRSTEDAVWPEPIWCGDKLEPCSKTPEKLKRLVTDFYLAESS